MTFKCPSCEADVPGVVTQDTLEQRINAKQGEITLLQGQLGTAADKAGRFDAVAADRDRLTVELGRATEGAARRDALVGLNIHDPKVHATFGVLFESAVAGLEVAERPDFAAWLADEETGARINPVLAPMFGTTAEPSGVPDPMAPAAARPAPVFPPTARAAQIETPGQDPKLPDAGAVRRMLQGMDVDQVKAWQAEHGHKYGWSSPPAAS